jgi:hypothetical protein
VFFCFSVVEYVSVGWCVIEKDMIFLQTLRMPSSVLNGVLQSWPEQ